MKKIIKLLAAAAILSYAGFFGDKYRLILPPLTDFIACAENITDSLSELSKKFSFGDH
ncbi:MAG: hypothetical protein IKK47_05405 [Ruminococcus sp.]|nr:hypothetical protein [Ruminococcus sp.]